MGQCRYCEKKGWFLRLDPNGLCDNCNPAVLESILNSNRVIEQSEQLIENSKNCKTRLSRCETIIQHAQLLLEYEERDIPTIRPLPSQMIKKYISRHDELLIEEVKGLFNKAKTKAEVAATTKTKTKAFSDCYVKAKEFLENLNKPSNGESLIKEIKKQIHSSTLNGYIQDARKAEFKGKTKKAIEQYQEALFFIKNDDIPDDLQSDEITEIEEKIQELSK